MTTLPLGSFSCRAHSTEDTIAVLMDALRPFDGASFARFQARAASIKPTQKADALGLVLALQHALNRFAPALAYVGHRIDDQSDWGVWIDLGKLHEAEQKGDLIQAHGPHVKTRATYVLQVGDRVKLWTRKGPKQVWEAP